MDFCNKQEGLSRECFSNLVYCSRASPGAQPRVEHLKGKSLRQALALPENNRLGWRGLLGTKTGATTLIITTFSITTLSIMGQVKTLSINDTQQ